MAAVTPPAQVAAKHQSLLHFVGNAPWSDAAQPALAKAGWQSWCSRRSSATPSPLRTKFLLAALAICHSWRLPTQRRRQSDPNGISPTRSPQCDDVSSSLSPGLSRDAPVAMRRSAKQRKFGGVENATVPAVRLAIVLRLPRCRGNDRIRRHGSAVILKPIADDWSWLEAIGGQLDEDFAHAVIAMLRERFPAGSVRATGETRRCRDLGDRGPRAFLWRVREHKDEP
jgi:virulence-associated protein VagC